MVRVECTKDVALRWTTRWATRTHKQRGEMELVPKVSTVMFCRTVRTRRHGERTRHCKRGCRKATTKVKETVVLLLLLQSHSAKL